MHRYSHGPTDQVLFDQAFDQLGQESNLLLPVGDHQNSTRVVLDGQQPGIRQSLDYAPFGRVTAIRDATGAFLVDAQGNPVLSAIITVHGHHGSLLDVATYLQHKGQRWYSPDLGRFISEDPIQDGSNWYMAFNNNPVLYVDPSGLSPNIHPLAKPFSTTLGAGPFNGSFGGPSSSSLDGFLRNSVNQALAPAIISGTNFGGFVGTGLGAGGLGLNLANAGQRPSSLSIPAAPAIGRTSLRISDFTMPNDLSAFHRAGPPSPQASPDFQRRARDLAFDDRTASFRRDYGPGGQFDFFGQSGAGEQTSFWSKLSGGFNDALREMDAALSGPEQREAVRKIQAWTASNREKVREVLPGWITAGLDKLNEVLDQTGGIGFGVPIGTVILAPIKKPLNFSRPQHGVPLHDATAFNRARAWQNDAVTVEARFNQQLVDASGNAVPGFRPDAQRIRVTPSGRKVVDVEEVRSRSQSEAFMNAKVEQIRKALGTQAGTIRWVEPVNQSRR